MKFTINRTEFFKALQRVGSAAMNYNRATHYNVNNVFRCIVFGVCGDVLTLEACDFAVGKGHSRVREADGEIKRLYEVLDNEGTPFEMEVKKRSPEGRTVKIHTEEKNVGYFSGLLNLNNK